MDSKQLNDFLQSKNNSDFIFGLCVACSFGEYLENCPFKNIKDNAEKENKMLLDEIEKIPALDSHNLITYHFLLCDWNKK